MTKCECGAELGYEITPFMTEYKRVCQACGKLNYIDTAPMDFSKIADQECLDWKHVYDGFRAGELEE